MTVIGLCGGTGSGKTTICRMLIRQGIPVFESDREYHRLTDCDSPCVRELVNAFGESVRTPAGGLDRREVCRIVFSGDTHNSAALATLNGITHRYVKEAFCAWMTQQAAGGAETVVLEAPLLFEAGMDTLCDVTVAVIAPEELRLERIMARDGISLPQALARISAQKSNEELIRLCDYMIENTGTMDTVLKQVNEIIIKIGNRGTKHE